MCVAFSPARDLWDDMGPLAQRAMDLAVPPPQVVVPTITPVQHDLPRFELRLQRAMRRSSITPFQRTGPLLLFAGGITSFSGTYACDQACRFTAPAIARCLHVHRAFDVSAACAASQDNLRKSGNDTAEKRLKWLRRVVQDPCAVWGSRLKPNICLLA